jgi:hypothetical protein
MEETANPIQLHFIRQSIAVQEQEDQQDELSTTWHGDWGRGSDWVSLVPSPDVRNSDWNSACGTPPGTAAPEQTEAQALEMKFGVNAFEDERERCTPSLLSTNPSHAQALADLEAASKLSLLDSQALRAQIELQKQEKAGRVVRYCLNRITCLARVEAWDRWLEVHQAMARAGRMMDRVLCRLEQNALVCGWSKWRTWCIIRVEFPLSCVFCFLLLFIRRGAGGAAACGGGDAEMLAAAWAHFRCCRTCPMG